MPTLERVTEGCVLGEGPHWDTPSQSLYLVDILGESILRYVPATKKLTKASLAPQKPSFIIPVESKKDEFLVGADNELLLLSWDGESSKVTILEKLQTLQRTSKAPNLVFNDAKCDSRGRLWAGSLSHGGGDMTKIEPLGSVYTYDNQRQLTSRVDGIRIANGLAFDDETKSFFYIDSLSGGVDRFDFDVTTGSVSNRQVWCSLSKHNVPGFPDGMTIDTDGNLWVAVFGAGRVLKVDGRKSETLLQTVDVPTEQVTSVTFGGPNLDELYVTTGAFEIEGKKFSSPEHGATYRVTGTGSRGHPNVSFKWD